MQLQSKYIPFPRKHEFHGFKSFDVPTTTYAKGQTDQRQGIHGFHTSRANSKGDLMSNTLT